MGKRWGVFLGLFVVFLVLTEMGAEGGSLKRLISTREDLTSLALTGYSGGFAVVREGREVSLPKGEILLLLQGVPERIEPESVEVSVEGGEVLEQTFSTNLITPDNLMKAYVGKKILVAVKDPETGKETVKEVKLLSVAGGPVFETDEGIATTLKGRVIFPRLPEGLVPEPTLSVSVRVPESGKKKVNLLYTTGGFSWKATYTLLYDRDKGRGSFGGWVTLKNETGADLEGADVLLVAGEVGKVRGPSPLRAKGVYTTLAAERAGAGVSEQPLFEYHSYSLPERVTVRKGESVQVRFAQSLPVEIAEEFLLEGGNRFFLGSQHGTTENLPVRVFLLFKNEKGKGPGIPLPAGTVKVYAPGGRAPLFLGEDSLPHTPEGADVRLALGNSFDVQASRRQVSFERVGREIYESSHEVVVKNRKRRDVRVIVRETLPGEWRILSSSHPYTVEDASHARFSLTVPGKGEVTLTYRVRVRQ
ncbi:MAG: hypothetical protein D6713_08850 [Deltaproteobacteria bacterium]|nr:MAG: hypothetical protein D6713_08850 [Deltaproteobacteria bacterium]